MTSTGRTSSRSRDFDSSPADDGPPPAREADPKEAESRCNEDIEGYPDAHDPPVSSESQGSERDEERTRRDHRPHEVRSVSSADQDPVEREHRTGERLHEHEVRPELSRPV